MTDWNNDMGREEPVEDLFDDLEVSWLRESDLVDEWAERKEPPALEPAQEPAAELEPGPEKPPIALQAAEPAHDPIPLPEHPERVTASVDDDLTPPEPANSPAETTPQTPERQANSPFGTAEPANSPAETTPHEPEPQADSATGTAEPALESTFVAPEPEPWPEATPADAPLSENWRTDVPSFGFDGPDPTAAEPALPAAEPISEPAPEPAYEPEPAFVERRAVEAEPAFVEPAVTPTPRPRPRPQQPAAPASRQRDATGQRNRPPVRSPGVRRRRSAVALVAITVALGTALSLALIAVIAVITVIVQNALS